jgi:broad specificity phosphatase PhoE
MEDPVPPPLTWLVRHGQSASNAGLPAVGHGDVPLTELGIGQAKALADSMARRPDLLILSPFLRARATAQPILARWPAIPCETWPIHELTCVSPARCVGTTSATRRAWIDDFWRRCDPQHCDGPDAESFGAFVARLRDFHRRLLALEAGFVVAIGHGQFFRAYLTGLAKGFEASPAWMRDYRRIETAQPMANCEVVELAADALLRAARLDTAPAAVAGLTPG